MKLRSWRWRSSSFLFRTVALKRPRGRPKKERITPVAAGPRVLRSQKPATDLVESFQEPEPIPSIGLQLVTLAESREDVGQPPSPSPSDHLVPQEDTPEVAPEESFHDSLLGLEHQQSKPQSSSKVLESFSNQSRYLDKATVTIMLKPPPPSPKPKKPSSTAKKHLSKTKKPSSRKKQPLSKANSPSGVQPEDLHEEEELPAVVPGPELPLVEMPRESAPEPHKPSGEKALVERVPEPKRPGSRVVVSDRGKESSSMDGVANHSQLHKTVAAHVSDALVTMLRYYTQGKDRKANRVSKDPLTVRTKDHSKNAYKTY